MTDTPRPRISIIIPAYCASDHLHLSVESLQAQTFTDFEIIIVEDNSPDDGATLGKAHQLAEADPRIRVARTKVNSGCGPSRNVGLDIARGEYVTFLDADDSLAPVALKNLIDLADKNNADIVCFAMERVYPSGKVLGHVENAQASVYDDPEEISEIALNAFSPSVGHGRKTYPIHTISRLIRRSLLDEAGIRFPSLPHLLSEDLPFVYAGMRRAKVYVFTPDTYYRYLQRPGSITHDPRPDMIQRSVASAEKFSEFLSQEKDAPQYAQDNAMGYALLGVRSYAKLMFTSNSSFAYKRRWVREQADIPYFRTVYEKYPWRSMPFKHKIGFWAFYRKHSLLLYALIVGQEKLRALLGKN